MSIDSAQTPANLLLITAYRTALRGLPDVVPAVAPSAWVFPAVPACLSKCAPFFAAASARNGG